MLSKGAPMNDALEPEFASVLREIMTKISSRDVGEFRSSQSLSELGLDSVSLAEVIVMLEDKYDVSLDQREIERIESFGDLQDLMQRARNR
jgi:acyl carrier protein